MKYGGNAIHYAAMHIVGNDVIHRALYILTSNENATPKCTSISRGYIEYTFTEDFW